MQFQKSKNSIFYSRNPNNLKQNIFNVQEKNNIELVIIDYEFKKAIDYGILSQSLQSIQEFESVYSLYLNFGNCALNTQKILLLMRGCSTFISKINQLYLLFENCNSIGLEGMVAICKILQECSQNLKVLVISLRKCNIGVDAATILFDCIQNLKLRFISVNLDNNEIKYTQKFGNSLKQFLDNSKDIQAVEISLSHNDIGSQGTKDISQALSNLKQSQYLLISLVGNQLGDDSINHLSKNLSILKQLRCLSISLDWNKITYKGASLLANAVSQMEELLSFSIDLDYNEIGAKGAQEISNCYSNAKDLQSLHINLAHNEIGDEGAQLIGLPLLKCIQNLSIELGWNKIGGQGVKVLTNNIEKYKTLQSLTMLLDNNNISSIGLNQISVCLLQLTNLQKLYLDLDDNGIPIDPVKALVTSLTGIPLQSLYVNLIKNEIDQNTIDNFSKLLLNNFPKIQSDNFALKSGQQKEESKITQSIGLTGTIIRFCEWSREKIQQNQTHLLISYNDFFTLFQEEIQVDIMKLLFEGNFNKNENYQIAINPIDQVNNNEIINKLHQTQLLQKEHQQIQQVELIQQPYNIQQIHQEQEIQQIKQKEDKNLNIKDVSFENLQEQNKKLILENQDLKKKIQNNQFDQFCKFLPLQDLICGKKISSSKSGELFLVSHNSQQLAMKIINLKYNQNNNSQQLSLQFGQVNDIIRSAQHKYILQIYGISFDFKEDGQLKIYLVIDFMKYNLLNFIKEQQGNENFELNLDIMKKVLEVLVYYQKNKLIHGNIKPANILLDENYQPKISDFGITKLIQFQNSGEDSNMLNVLSPKYCGPDIFDGKESQFIDVWSFGCIIFQMFSGEQPWSGLNEFKQLNQMVHKITILQHYKSQKDCIQFHPKIEEIIDKCTRYESRINAEQLMAIFPTQLTSKQKNISTNNELPKTKIPSIHNDQSKQNNSVINSNNDIPKTKIPSIHNDQSKPNNSVINQPNIESSIVQQSQLAQSHSNKSTIQRFDPNERTRTMKKK